MDAPSRTQPPRLFRFGPPTRIGLLVWLLTGFSAQAAQPPRLGVRTIEPASLALEWPEGEVRFVLESAPSLRSGTLWGAVSTSGSTANGVRTVTLSRPGQQQYYRLRDAASLPLTTISETSPMPGEEGVSVLRETIVRFSQALHANVVLGPTNFYAELGGRQLLSRIELASDHRTATLFYLEPLPAGARIQVHLVGDTILDAQGVAVDAEGDGQPGGSHLLKFDTMRTASVAGTAVSGHVYASDRVSLGGQPANQPLAGVLITVDGAEEKLRTVTDANGFFFLKPCPAGRFFVHIDGRTARGSTWPNGSYYPVVGKTFEATVGTTNPFAGGSGEIFLPLIPSGTLQTVSPTESTRISFPATVLAQNPKLTGVQLTVPANALFADNGIRGGKVGIAPVAPDRIPSPLPPGLAFPLVITVQTDGPANFAEPVPVRFPNLPDPITGKPLAPGAKARLWSFTHDTGRWEPQGSMTVSPDGQFVESDAGMGVRQPGWHGVNPGSPPRFPSFPDPRPSKERECVPLTPEHILVGALEDRDCFGEAVPFFNAFKKLADAGAALTEAAGHLTTLLTGDVPESLHAACSSLFLASDLFASAAEGLSAAATKTYLAEILECEVNVLKRNLTDSCQIANCLAGGALPPECLAILEDLNSLESAIEEAKGFSEDPTEYGKGKLDSALRAACDAVDTLTLSPAPAGVRLAGDPIPPETLAQIRAGAQQALDQVLILQRIAIELQPLTADFEQVLAADQALMEQVYTPIWAQLELYRNAYYRLSYSNLEFRGRSTSLGHFELPILAPNVQYTFEIYDPVFNVVAIAEGTSAPSDRDTLIPNPVWRYPGLTDLSPDQDHDGLTQWAEAVIGTSDGKADTDGDGINDLSEIQQGQDPLSGLNLPLGVIANVPLFDTAYAVEQRDGIAYLATGTYGLAIVDVQRPEAPVLLSQLDLPGLNISLAFTAERKVLAIAALPERVVGFDYALHFVDVADGTHPRLLRSYHLPVKDVAADQGLTLAALDREVRVYDSATGTEMGWFSSIDQVVAITAQAGRVYLATSKGLEIYQLALPGAQLLGRLNLGEALLGSTLGSGDLLVDGDIIHTGSRYRTIDISDVEHPVLLGQTALPFPAILHSLALNGAGRMVAVISFSGSSRDIAIYDATDPTKVDEFLASFRPLSVARDAVLMNGFALVADSTAGLSVMNLASIDTLGQPPSVDLEVSSLDIDPQRPGLQVVAGSRLWIRAKVSEDVQLRQSRFILDGKVVGTSDHGPVILPVDLPSQVPANGISTLRVESIDTAGNIGVSLPVTLEVLPDVTPPQLESAVPNDSGGVHLGEPLIWRFNEFLATSPAPDPSLIILTEAGPDGLIGTIDDQRVSIRSVEIREQSVIIVPMNELRPGWHQIEIAAKGVQDRAGNTLSQDLRRQFRAAPGTGDLATWIGPANGAFETATNWMHGRVPRVESVLLPASGGSPVVSFTTENITLLSLDSQLPIRIEPGAELTVKGPWFSSAGLVISNGGAWVDGTGTFQGPVDLQGGSLNLNSPATFDRALNVGRGAALILNGTTSGATLRGGFAGTNLTLSAREGAKLTITQLIDYDGPGEFSLFIPAGTLFEARGAGSQLSLPELRTANGPSNWIVRSVPSLKCAASAGGVLELPRLSALTGRSTVSASGAGSRILATNLSLLNGPDSAFLSSLLISANGEIQLGSRAAVSRCNVSLNAPATLRCPDLELIENTTLEGSGTLAGNLRAAGTITLNQAAAALTIQGSLELTPSATTTVSLGLGTARNQAGRLEVQGAAHWNGRLKLAVPRGVTLSAGSDFLIATASQDTSGTFSELDDSALGATLQAELAVAARELRIRILARP